MRFVAAILLFSSLSPTSSAADRPKIGLVLEGGGALGYAHIGVLQWFDDHHIPIDAIAGTSMGGLVGGLYAAGQTPKDIQSLVGGVDWPAVLRTQPPFPQVSFRRKEDRIAYPNILHFGWRNGLALPAGLNAGQPVDTILDRVLLPDSDLKSFDDLPIPFRCVSANLISGAPKVFDSGSLAAAIRATISIPALFIPEDRPNAVYIDGGTLDNLPVDVAKKMNVDIIIAVHLDTGPPKADFQQSLIGIAERTVSITINANELRSMQLADILLSANVEEFSTSDFTKSAEIIPRGAQAAQNKQALLSKFSLPDDEWQTYLAARRARIRTATPVPEFISVKGTTPIEQEYIQKSLANQIGKPLDTTSIEKGLANISAQGAFESLRYAVVEESGKPGLGIFAAQKTNGPPFLNFGLTIDGSDPSDVRFGVATRLTFLNLGGFRSEWRTDIAIGNLYQFSTEYYRPFTGTSNWFLAPHAHAGTHRLDIYNSHQRIAEYDTDREGAGLALGYSLGHSAEFRIGEELVARQIDLKLGSPITPNYQRASGDSSALFRYFGQDDTVIPHKGFNSQTRVDWFTSRPFGGAYHVAESKSSLFIPVSENGSIWFTANGGSAFGAKNLGLDSFNLGGPFRLGAYGIHELLGNQYLLLQGGFSHQIVTFNPLFGGAIYGLAWYESGKIYGDPLIAGLPFDGSVALVAKTALGPIYAGASMASTARIKWWFGLGRVF